jgi:hypothetical protein
LQNEAQEPAYCQTILQAYFWTSCM